MKILGGDLFELGFYVLIFGAISELLWLQLFPKTLTVGEVVVCVLLWLTSIIMITIRWLRARQRNIDNM